MRTLCCQAQIYIRNGKKKKKYLVVLGVDKLNHIHGMSIVAVTIIWMWNEYLYSNVCGVIYWLKSKNKEKNKCVWHVSKKYKTKKNMIIQSAIST